MKCKFCGSKAFSFYELSDINQTAGPMEELITLYTYDARCEECKAHYKIIERWEILPNGKTIQDRCVKQLPF